MTASNDAGAAPGCDERLELTTLRGVPIVGPGDDLAGIILTRAAAQGIDLRPDDVLVVASKLISRVEGCFVDLGALKPSASAFALARKTGSDARMVELVLSQSVEVSRTAPGALITRNRHGIICANAGVDLSNARPSDAKDGTGPWALTLPADPDSSARKLFDAIRARANAHVGVIISDSVGRPFRLGSVGIAIGLAGVPAVWDQRGGVDLFGRTLEHTLTAFADQVATSADLVAGQGAEGRGVVHVRGLRLGKGEHSSEQLVRPPDLDLYALGNRG